MNNEERVEIGRSLLEQFSRLSQEYTVDGESTRDAICDILHAAVVDKLLRVEDLVTVCYTCADHVREELNEQPQSGN